MRASRAALFLAGLLAAAAPARAEVQGSPHDLIPQNYDLLKTSLSQDRCSRCHLAGAGDGPNLLRTVPPVLAAYGPPSLLCFSCHDGITIVSPEVDASATAFHPRSHGTNLGRVELPADLGLPGIGGAHLECTTCHDPHTNDNRPFLRAQIGELCLLCHARLYGERSADESTGTHPQGMVPEERLVETAESRVPISVGEAFRTPFPAPYPVRDGRESVGTHWDLGGHLAGGGDGELACITCHAVHGDESSPPLPALLAVDPVREDADRFCEGCHAGRRGDDLASPPRPNPGGTQAGRTYHPADDDEANGKERIVEIREPEGWPFGTGSPRPLLCTTCHRAHEARPETSLLRPTPGDTPFCEACHEDLLLSWHHVALDDAAGRCSEGIAATTTLPARRLTCERCHRAHNAGFGSGAEERYVPLLNEPLDGTSCLACHPADNPTCAEDPDHRASHFLGDPTSPETYADPAPPLRTDPWPESKLPSLYAGARGQEVTCLSCHAFREGAVVSGDKGAAPHLLALSGNPVEWGDDESVYLCTGCHSANPGTGTTKKGHTHPLMSGEVGRLGRDPVAPVTATVNGRINCDSCHRPHEAETGSGYYIMEVVTSDNDDPRAVHPQIDFTVICQSCHDPGKY